MESLIQRSVVPMFRRPDPLSEHVSQALLGQRVTLQSGSDTWRLIRTPDGYEGWVAAAALTPLLPEWQEPWGEIEDLWANLRAQPDYRLAPMTQAPIGTRLPVFAEQEGWLGLLLPDGRKAWTEASRVRRVAAAAHRPATGAALVRTARRFLGIPYLWGGKSPIGIDCSGLVQTVYGLHGIALLRDASQQATQGRRVETPRAGDLAFFHAPEDKERITHVAMMLDRRRFVHASGGRCVRIDDFSDATYGHRLKQHRRLLGGQA